MHQVLQMRLCSILTPLAGTWVNNAGRLGAQHPHALHVHMCPSCAQHPLCFAHPCGAPGIPVPHSRACGVAEMSHRESATSAGWS